MATTLECGSAEPHSPQISPPTWLPQDLRLVCAYMYVWIDWGRKGEREREVKCVGISLPHWLFHSSLCCPSCRLNHSVVHPFWKVNMIRIPGLKWHSPHFLGTWATSSWAWSALWTGTVTGLWGWLSHSPNTSRPARSYRWWGVLAPRLCCHTVTHGKRKNSIWPWQTVICVPRCVYVCQCDDNHEKPEPAELIAAALSRELKNRDIQIFSL